MKKPKCVYINYGLKFKRFKIKLWRILKCIYYAPIGILEDFRK